MRSMTKQGGKIMSNVSSIPSSAAAYYAAYYSYKPRQTQNLELVVGKTTEVLSFKGNDTFMDV